MVCPKCKRTAEKIGWCVICTILRFRTEGVPLTISHALSYGGALLEHPEWIVKLEGNDVVQG